MLPGYKVSVAVPTKFAVIVPVPLIVAVVEAALGLAKVIDPVLCHWENAYPVFADADMDSEPAFCHVPEPVGLVVPAPLGLTPKVTWYWCA